MTYLVLLALFCSIFLLSILVLFVVIQWICIISFFYKNRIEKSIYVQITDHSGRRYYYDPFEVYNLDPVKIPTAKDYSFRSSELFGPVYIAENNLTRISRKIQPGELIMIIFYDSNNVCEFKNEEYNGKGIKIITVPFRCLEYRSIPVKK